jgi:hypothetical protein
MDSSDFYAHINYNPDADGMIENMEFGGLDLSQVIEELVDNSEEYGAKFINCYLLADGSLNEDGTSNKKMDQLIIMDNAKGMSSMELANSIIMAKKHTHVSGAHGKFGMGLKNSTMALGNNIVILTKQNDGVLRSIYMDLLEMRRENTYKPTWIGEGIGTLQATIARNTILQKFLEQESGTLISIKNIKMDIENVETEANKLKISLGHCYTHKNSDINIYTSTTNDSIPLTVSTYDSFYKKNTGKCDYIGESVIHVYLSSDKKRVDSVIEVIEKKRLKKTTRDGKRDYYTNTKLKHSYEEHRTEGGRIKYIHKVVKVNSLPTTQCHIINTRFVSIEENAYISENNNKEFEGIPHRRRGLWFYRGTRNVGLSIQPKYVTLDDWSNRSRMEVVYPSELDYHMGVRTQKQMSSITSNSIEHAINGIFYEQNKAVINLRKKENKQKKEESDDESDSESILSTTSSKVKENVVKKEEQKEVVHEEKEKEEVVQEEEEEVVQEEEEEEGVIHEEKEKEEVVHEEEEEEEIVKEEEEQNDVILEEKEEDKKEEEQQKEVVHEEKEDSDNESTSEKNVEKEKSLDDILKNLKNTKIPVKEHERSTSKSQKDLADLLLTFTHPEFIKKVQDFHLNASNQTNPDYTNQYNCLLAILDIITESK